MISFENFICPHCSSPLGLDAGGKSLLCGGSVKRHCFDLSSSGYVNFAPPSQSGSGDSKEAIRARTRFLESDGYKPVCQEIIKMVGKYCHGGLVVDAGSGEGYYTNLVAEAYDGEVAGFDLSKFGVENGAKTARRKSIENVFFAVGSVFSIPLADNCADGIINIFAPCVEAEYSRILKSGGVLITAEAGEDHLLGLKNAIYDSAYKNTEREDMPKSLRLAEEKRVSFMLALEDKQLILDLFSMTPYYYRTSEKSMNKLLALDRLETEVDIKIKVFYKE